MRFEFSTPGRIIFGEGALKDAITAVQMYGKHALLVLGGGERVSVRLQDILSTAGIPYTVFRVVGEPDIAMVEEGVKCSKTCGADVVLGCGGGSAVDTAKAVACLATNPGDVLDYLEVVGKGRALIHPGLPLVAVPTTAGTGSEVTRNAVLSVPENRMKVSLRSSFLYPSQVVVDPELTYSVPPDVTASTGMDALAQVLEPFVSIRANPMTDLYCRSGMEAVGRSLLPAYLDGANENARREMSWGSLMGGLALANSGLGAVHGFASPLGGMFPAPHGVLCARLLAPVVEVNFKALSLRDPGSQGIERYSVAAQIILGSTHAGPMDLIHWLEELCKSLQIPGLREYGIQPLHFDEIIENAIKASSMKANPLQLSGEELREILDKSL